ncbi:50S ribosomal protein L4 [Calidifontibacter sp. DB0510]|uniref:Large ribosomal subunit protein uL4 n=1 Tax=Metallococcus carri TaxID=1656884 RepID=A0A967B0I9_9MICO|nr:50S ribosomal protein L4 [Metallococcus carri]NHN55183.1 50S ribosomal protein L4 [Metallococcus carri]NOP36260.1 50S ribosomal protein L4 [Calidifontibacter sp. DB2511S]
MTTIDIVSPSGSANGSVELPAEIFDVATNVPLIHQVVVAQLAAARQGTHATKTRGEVRGGGRKPYRQKGTGRARQGSTRAPQFAGGGVVHGPQPRDYSQRTPKKMKAAALRGALSDRARHGRIHVLTSIVDGDTPSARTAAKVLAGLTDRKNLLVVVDRAEEIAVLSVRNLAGVHLLWADQLNTYDVLCSDDIVFTKAALDSFLAGPLQAAKLDKAEAKPVKTEAKPGKAETPAKAAPAAKVEAPAAASSDATDGGFGAESAAPLADGASPDPAKFQVKGNKDSMKYHVPGSRWYDATVAEVWFTTGEAAAAAGFAPAGGAAAQQVKEDDK